MEQHRGKLQPFSENIRLEPTPVEKHRGKLQPFPKILGWSLHEWRNIGVSSSLFPKILGYAANTLAYYAAQLIAGVIRLYSAGRC